MQRWLEFFARHGKRNIGSTVLSNVLNDHVDRNLAVGDCRKDLAAFTRDIGNAKDRHTRLIWRHRRAANRLADRFGFRDNHRSFGVGETASDVNRNAKLFCKLDGSTMHHAGAKARQFEHLVIADHINTASFRKQSGIGGVNAIHIGVNLTCVRSQDGRKGDRRGVAATSAERRDVQVIIDPLKPGRDHDVAVFEQSLDPLRRNRLDARLAKAVVGLHADLATGQANRLGSKGMNGHCDQRDAHLFPGAEQHVHLTRRRAFANLARQT